MDFILSARTQNPQIEMLEIRNLIPDSVLEHIWKKEKPKKGEKQKLGEELNKRVLLETHAKCSCSPGKQTNL